MGVVVGLDSEVEGAEEGAPVSTTVKVGAFGPRIDGEKDGC